MPASEVLVGEWDKGRGAQRRDEERRGSWPQQQALEMCRLGMAQLPRLGKSN